MKMGRTNAKLIPFLRQYLTLNTYLNLLYEDEQNGVFIVILPRFDKEKIGPYEQLLKAWYDFNDKLDKYKDYSNAKSVLQAALKKSIYLVTLPAIGSKLRFRFATNDEIKENRRRQHERERARKEQRSVSPHPPSPSSSGYHSGTDDSEVENMQTSENQIPLCFDDILTNPEQYIGDCGSLDDFFRDLDFAVKPEEQVWNQNPLPDDAFVEQNPELPTLNLAGDLLSHPVTELKMTPVCALGPVKKYWLCTKKIKIKSTLQLICESKVIENESTGIKEGTVVIPNGVFESGVSYDMKKSFEFEGMLYCFFSSNLA